MTTTNEGCKSSQQTPYLQKKCTISKFQYSKAFLTLLAHELLISQLLRKRFEQGALAISELVDLGKAVVSTKEGAPQVLLIKKGHCEPLKPFAGQTRRDRRLSCLCPLIDMPEVPKLSPLGLSFCKPVRSEGSTKTEPSSLADLSVL
ncbi:hypothetical protein Tco_0688752 [Tanacetum coccineum]